MLDVFAIALPLMALNIVLLILAAALMGYLIYALLRPEKF